MDVAFDRMKTMLGKKNQTAIYMKTADHDALFQAFQQALEKEGKEPEKAQKRMHNAKPRDFFDENKKKKLENDAVTATTVRFEVLKKLYEHISKLRDWDKALPQPAAKRVKANNSADGRLENAVTVVRFVLDNGRGPPENGLTDNEVLGLVDEYSIALDDNANHTGRKARAELGRRALHKMVCEYLFWPGYNHGAVQQAAFIGHHN